MTVPWPRAPTKKSAAASSRRGGRSTVVAMCACATERVVWPPLLKPREPLCPLPRPSLCDLCLLPPVFVPECNKLKKDALTVSHSDPAPLPNWSLKCSHGPPRSGGSSGGGRKCPSPCSAASRPTASTASEWQGGHWRSKRVPRRVGSAPYSTATPAADTAPVPDDAPLRLRLQTTTTPLCPQRTTVLQRWPPATATSCRTRARGR